jgi:hypothetical protein
LRFLRISVAEMSRKGQMVDGKDFEDREKFVGFRD